MEDILRIKSTPNNNIKRIPVYELSCALDSSYKDTYKAAILKTYSWLREVISKYKGDADYSIEYDFPEFDFPEPAKHQSVKLTDFIPGFYEINDVDINIVTFSEPTRSWVVKVTENASEEEAGRFYETLVCITSFRKEVQCTFQKIVIDYIKSENKKYNTSIPKILDSFISDRKFSVGQFIDIIDGVFSQHSNQNRQFKEYAERHERTLPIVLINTRAPQANNMLLSQNNAKTPLIEHIKSTYMPPLPTPLHIMKVASELKGKALFFNLEMDPYKFTKETGFEIPSPGISIIYPAIDGEIKVNTFPTQQLTSSDVENATKKLHNFFVGKTFLPEFSLYDTALQCMTEEYIEKNLEMNLRELDCVDAENPEIAEPEALETKSESYEEIIKDLQDRLTRERIKNDKLRRRIDNLEETVREFKGAVYPEILPELSEAKEQTQPAIPEPTEADKTLPKTAKDIVSWTEQYLQDTMLLTDNAKRLLKDYRGNNARVISQGLEYLAGEYHDWLSGKISKSELKDNAGRHYNRPFEVRKLGDMTMNAYKEKYSVNYEKDGKTVTIPITHHLMVGNKNGELIRIYFAVEKDTKRIIVGALPNHLPTLSYQ